jgi:hypothetical protein
MQFPCKMYSCNSEGVIETVTMLSFGIVGDATMPTFTGKDSSGRKFLTSSGMYHETIAEAIAEAIEDCVENLDDYQNQINELTQHIADASAKMVKLVELANKGD